MRKRWVTVVATAGSVATVCALTTAGVSTAAASTHSGGVRPNATNMVDCNGHSPKYKAVKAGLGGLCTDPIAVNKYGTAYRFRDNGVYIGHDEPSVKFISNQPGSGNQMTYVMRLSRDPRGTPTTSPTGTTTTDYAELTPAAWFGLPMCDRKSYPQNPCTPDSDTNTGAINNPNDAGSAFMELQFYAPKFQPFIDSPSCNARRWCVALTIDSLSCTFGFATCNNNCIEPVNFAFLQRNGVPAGPPGPQLSDTDTMFPNKETLMMNPGDTLVVNIRDTSQGLMTAVTDLNTEQTGFMVASAANGFMDTNIADCTGTPFSFHPEYSTAQQQNQVPWAALEGGVLMQQELGHFEPCDSVTNSFPINDHFGNGESFSDPGTAQTCVGGYEGAGKTGEGPCSLTTGNCGSASTEGGAACPSNNFASGNLCEFSDAICAPAGSRTIDVNGTPETVSWPVAGCQANFFQNGDLDFEGSDYVADWPDGSKTHPTSFAYIGPFTGGHTYPNIQFETDLAASEITCDVATGAGCAAPPIGPNGPAFYPFWSLAHGPEGGCVWNFGNNIAGRTVQNFGMDAEYGTPDVARFGGTLTSPVMSNPQLGSCRSGGRA
ncbi:MAG TPA: hypothetical protein VGS19_03185 [Streptosporangiaceae bacterium]|nr:hypothetical protein [Streptosporangiaceae bacterium]